MEAILFLGTSLVSAQYLPEAAKLLGYKPIFLLNIEDYSGDPRRYLEHCEYYKADVNSLDDIIRAIEENHLMKDVVAITSFLDETLGDACNIAEKYGIIGPDPALTQLTDKSKVRDFIPEFSPPCLNFKMSDISEEILRNFINKCDHLENFLLKPGISSGAVGIRILNKDTSVDQIIKYIQESGITNADHHNWMIQPRIKGELYSLEGFVKDGRFTFLGFADRVRKEFTEVASEFPVDQELSPELQKKCQEALKALVARSGYKNGFFHCEFIINSDAYLKDPNMGRFSGGGAIQHTAQFYKMEVIDLVKHVVDLSIFKGVHTANYQYNRTREDKTITINYCLEKPATILSIELPHNLTSFHTQIAGDGRVMPGVGTSDSAWVGFLAGFKDTVLKEIQQIVIHTNHGPVSPFYLLDEN